MELTIGNQLILVIVGIWAFFYLLPDDDGPSDGGPPRKRKAAPIRVRINRPK
jgi:hypothetical protein